MDAFYSPPFLETTHRHCVLCAFCLTELTHDDGVDLSLDLDDTVDALVDVDSFLLLHGFNDDFAVSDKVFLR